MTKLIPPLALLSLLLPTAVAAAPPQLFAGSAGPTRTGEPPPPVLIPARWGESAGALAASLAQNAPPPDTAEAEEDGEEPAAAGDQPAAQKTAANPAAAESGEAPATASSSRGAGQVPLGGQCATDDDCVEGAYCDRDRCRLVQRPINFLYLFYRSSDRRFTQIMGVYWHRQGDVGYRVLAPVYWHFWGPEERTQIVFPFYFRHERQDGVTTTVIPPFQYRRTPTERNYRFWPLVFWTDYGERGSGLTVLPFFHRAREGRRTSTVLPLLLSMYRQDPERELSQGLILGLYYWRQEGESRSRALLPMFYRSRTPGRSFTWTAPLNFFWRRGEDQTLLVIPFAYSRTSPPRAVYLGLLPPVIYSRVGRRSHLLAPLFYRYQTAESSLMLAGPFYRRCRSDGGGDWGVVPLLFKGQRPESSYLVLFPAIWHFSSRASATTVAGPFFYQRSGPRTTAGLFPLAVFHRDRAHGSRTALTLPLFFYRSELHGRRARFVSPLLLYERDEDAQVKHWGLLAPLYYHRRDAELEVDTLIPLALRWHNRVLRSTTWVVGPIIYQGDPEGGTQVVFPLFWRFRDARSGASTAFLFPLYYRHKRPDGSHLNVIFPFYYKRRTDGWSAGLLPLLFGGRRGEQHHAVVFPAYWHITTLESSTTVAGPLFYRREARRWRAGLAPLLFLGAGEGESHQVLFPALWHLRSERQGYDTWVAGPAFYARSRKGHAAGLVPLAVWGEWRGRRFQAVLPPLFYRSAGPEPGRSFLLAGLYYGFREPGLTGHTVFPVFYYRRAEAADGSRTLTAALAPLFFYRDRPQDRLLVTPAGGWRQDRRTGASEGLIGPYAWHRSPATRGFALVPILLHWTRPRQQSTTTVVFPIGVRHVSPRESAHVWFPFFWKLREPGQRSLVVFPVYWQLHQDRGLQAQVVFPLYWNIRSPARRLLVAGPVFSHRTEHSYQAGVVPLAHYRRTSEGSRLIALPAIWYARDAEARQRTWLFGPAYYRSYDGDKGGYATGIVPLLFGKSTAEESYAVVAPLLWHFSRPPEEKSTTVFGPAFYHRRQSYRMTGLAPVFYTSWDRAGRRSVLLAPLAYYRREPARSALYTPLFGRDSSPARTVWYAGPYFQRTSPTSSTHILFPLALRHRNHVEGRTTFIAAPLYFGRWSAERSMHVAFPLVWRQRRIDSSTTAVLPLFWDFHDRHVSRTTLLLPLLVRHRDHVTDTTNYVSSAGVWVRRRSEAVDAVVFPLVWHFGGAKRSSTVGFPLYWDFKREQSRTTVVFPLYWRFDRPNHRAHLVLNTYLSRGKRDSSYYNFLFFPLLQVQRKRPGDLKLELLLGLFGYERIGRYRLLTFFYFITTPIGATGSQTLSGFGGLRQVSWSGRGP